MRPPRILVPSDIDGLYHVVSRVVDRRMIFGEEEKTRFRELLVGYAGFSGIKVVAWCLMDNHFHLLLHVPSKDRMDPGTLPEKEILRRLHLIYGEAEMAEVERGLGMCVEETSRRRYLERFTRRMGNLAMFMRSLKQRFSRWYNGRNRRKGTLWEERYRSVVVEIQELATLGHAARIVAAYIDLNPVRAGMVEDPADYKWSGYGRAVRGEKSSVRGVVELWGRQMGVKAALADYRVFLFEEGSEERMEEPMGPPNVLDVGHGAARLTVGGGTGRKQNPRTGEWKTCFVIDARRAWDERQRGGRLPLHLMLRLKTRYLVDGLAIGNADFLSKLGRQTAKIGAAITPDSKSIGKGSMWAKGGEGTPMRFGQWGGLRVLRNLRVRVVG